MADATDLKSVDPKGSCGFESRHRHQSKETGNGAQLGELYFESLAQALIIVVVSQADSRLPDAGNSYVQDERVQKALSYRGRSLCNRSLRLAVVRIPGCQRR
jgi:hypothetical protein